MTKGKKRPSKRAAVLAVWARMEDPNISHEEFLKAVHFVERNSPQWRRKPRRSNAEVTHQKVLEMERAARVLRHTAAGKEKAMSKTTPSKSANQGPTRGAYLGAPDPLTNPGLPEPFQVPATHPRDREIVTLSQLRTEN